MKKVIIFSILSIVLPLMAMAQQRQVPSSVQQFLDEHAFTQRVKTTMPGITMFNRFVTPQMVNGTEMVDAFIAIEGSNTLSALEQQGVIVNCLFDGFVTAQVPVRRLVDISMMPGVADLEVSRVAQLCTDSTLSVTHAAQLIQGKSNGLVRDFDGSGVIIGIIDKGFDYQHRAFRRNDNPDVTRIVRVYDTQATTGHPAYYNKTAKLPGSVFMGDEIYGLTTDSNGSTHGTHTASVAAGTHVNGYGGMAPGADIVMCAISKNEGNLSVVELANSMRYIDSYADSVGKPCVMSLSVSIHGGQHDGQDYFSKAVKQTMGPGRIFVVAAGNTADHPYYAYKQATPADPMNMLIYCKALSGADSSYFYSHQLAEVWVRNSWKKPYYKMHVLDKTTGNIVWESEAFIDGIQLPASDLMPYYNYDSSVDTEGYIKVNRKNSSDGKKTELSLTLHNLITQEYTTSGSVKKSRYAIGMSVYPQTDITLDIDAWIGNSYGGFGSYNGPVTGIGGEVSQQGFYVHGNDSCSIGTLAVSDSIISAGAYAARNSYYSYYQNRVIKDNAYTVGDIASFSSYQAPGYGPTGAALPTICAPGVDVVAAGSQYSYFAQGNQSTVMKTEDGGYWGVMTGTSLAAPTVAGIIAQWLQANPRLSVAQIKNILARSAIRDDYTMGAGSNHFGPNGKIDALAGMQLVLNGLGYVIGDVDGNGIVGIDDLTLMIDFLLGVKPVGFDDKAADVDGDGHINIADITELIDYLLR